MTPSTQKGSVSSMTAGPGGDYVENLLHLIF